MDQQESKKSHQPPHRTVVKWPQNVQRKQKRTTNIVTTPEPIVKEAIESTKIVKKTKRTSEIWDHFTIHEVDGEPRALCKYCSANCGARGKQDGTGNLHNHINRLCKKYPYRVAEEKQKTLVLETQKDGTTLKSISYSYENCRVKLAEMIILDEHPFRVVKGEGFRRFLAECQPKFTLPRRITVVRDCMNLYFEHKKRIKQLMKGERICLTTDIWTSIQNISYLCLTGHWIDKDWKLQKRILSLCVIVDHKGKTIGKMIEKKLVEWGIDKFLILIVDNAYANDSTIDYLKKKTRSWKTTILNHDYLHLRYAHILNLIVKHGLKIHISAILKIRNVVRYVRSSPFRLQDFKDCATVEKIESVKIVCLDIETRWNSTYLMLDSAFMFEKAFDRIKEDDAN